MWVATQTRPIIWYVWDEQYWKISKSEVIVWGQQVTLKLKLKTAAVSFLQLGKPMGLNIVCYSDGTYVSLEDGFLQGHFIISVCGRMNTIAFRCKKKLDWITKTPLVSETLSFSEVADTGILIAATLQEIFKLPRLLEVFCKTNKAFLVETLKPLNLVSNQHLGGDSARVKKMMVTGVRTGYRLPNKVGASSDILRDFESIKI